MISSITDSCIPAIVCSQHTRLVNRNRLCCYRYSHTFLITGLFAAYHTHHVKFNRFCSLGSTQTVHPSELYVVYRTHLHLAARFCCSASSQTVHPSEPYALHRTHLHLEARFFCSSSSQTVNWTERMPWIAQATKIWTVFDASVIANVLHLFWRFLHHRLWLLHRTQFRQRFSDRSVALAASYSSDCTECLNMQS